MNCSICGKEVYKQTSYKILDMEVHTCHSCFEKRWRECNKKCLENKQLRDKIEKDRERFNNRNE